MKINLLILSILLSATSILSAQIHERGTVELVPNIGFSASDVYGDVDDDSDYRSDVQFGVVGDYYFNNRWSLRSGLSYFNMGTKIYEFELKLSYLNIPINANWHFGSKRRWNLNFGLTPGFLLSTDSDFQDAEDAFNTFQLAFSYGIGYKIGITEKFSLLLDLQSVVGLTNILDQSDGANITNSGASLNIGGVFVLD